MTAPIVNQITRTIRPRATLDLAADGVSGDAYTRALHGTPRPVGQLWERLAEGNFNHEVIANSEQWRRMCIVRNELGTRARR